MPDRNPDQFDKWLRKRSGRPVPLPADFRRRVWSQIEAGRNPGPLARWFAGTAFDRIPPLRLALSCTLTAILLSAFAGYLIAPALPRTKADLFPSVRSAPDFFSTWHPTS